MVLPEIATPGTTPNRPPPPGYWLRLALAAGWIAMAVTAAGIGERTTDLDDLNDALAAGRVDGVSVSGTGLGPEDSGFATQEVHWRQGLVRRVSTVVVHDSEDVPTSDSTTTIVSNDVGAYLSERHPRLRVTRSAEIDVADSLLGWQVPRWVALLGFAVNLTALAVLVHGPQPWRATRWAWFWIWTTPIGTPAFLLLSGPTPLLPAPRHLSRRLTGGWAFFVSVIVFGSH